MPASHRRSLAGCDSLVARNLSVFPIPRLTLKDVTVCCISVANYSFVAPNHLNVGAAAVCTTPSSASTTLNRNEHFLHLFQHHIWSNTLNANMGTSCCAGADSAPEVPAGPATDQALSSQQQAHYGHDGHNQNHGHHHDHDSHSHDHDQSSSVSGEGPCTQEGECCDDDTCCDVASPSQTATIVCCDTNEEHCNG